MKIKHIPTDSERLKELEKKLNALYKKAANNEETLKKAYISEAINTSSEFYKPMDKWIAPLKAQIEQQRININELQKNIKLANYDSHDLRKQTKEIDQALDALNRDYDLALFAVKKHMTTKPEIEPDDSKKAKEKYERIITQLESDSAALKYSERYLQDTTLQAYIKPFDSQKQQLAKLKTELLPKILDPLAKYNIKFMTTPKFTPPADAEFNNYPIILQKVDGKVFACWKDNGKTMQSVVPDPSIISKALPLFPTNNSLTIKASDHLALIRSITEALAIPTVEPALRDYQDAIKLLETFRGSFIEQREKINDRIKVLDKLYQKYEEVKLNNKETLEKAQAVISEQKKYSDTYYDPAFNEVRKSISAQINKLKGKNYLIDGNQAYNSAHKTINVASQIENDIKAYEEDIIILNNFVDTYKEKTQAVEEKTNKQLNEFNKDQQKAIVTFNFINERLKQIPPEYLSSEINNKIAAKKQDFDRVSNLENSDLLNDPVKFAKDKVGTLTLLGSNLQAIVHEQEEYACKAIQEKIKIIHEQIQANYDKNMGKYDKNYKYQSQEIALIKQINTDYAEINNSANQIEGQNFTHLNSLYAKLIEQQSSLAPLFDKAAEIFAKHEQIKNCMENKITLDELINQKTEQQAIELIKLYKDNVGEFTTLKNLNTTIANLDKEAIKACRIFILGIDSKSNIEMKKTLQNKLEFIEILQNQNIEHQAFLNKKNVAILMDLTKKLHELKLDKYITSDLLNNSEACDALHILNQSDLLTAENVAAITNSNKRVQLINHQQLMANDENDLYNFNKNQFKELMQQILSAPDKVIDAANNIIEKGKECPPWLFLLLSKSNVVTEIFQNEDQVECNLEIIELMFNVPIYTKYMPTSYLDKDNDDTNVARAAFQKHLANNGSQLNNVLRLNKSGNIQELDQMIKVYKELANKLSTLEEKIKNPKKLKEESAIYLPKALSILLDRKPLEEKRDNLNTLAKETFKPHRSRKNLRKAVDIAQILTGLFLIIMPIRAAFGRSALFSKSKTTGAKAVTSTINKEILPLVRPKK